MMAQFGLKRCEGCNKSNKLSNSTHCIKQSFSGMLSMFGIHLLLKEKRKYIYHVSCLFAFVVEGISLVFKNPILNLWDVN